MNVVVVGAGVGGLAASIRLAVAGHDVTVFERNRVVGGKLATLDVDGYTFDVGPSLLTLPDVFDELFRVAGTSLREQVDLVRLDPQFRYRWPDGSMLEVADDDDAWLAELDRFSPGAATDWTNFSNRTSRIWETSARTFLAGPMSGPWSLLKRMRSPADLLRIDGARTLARSATSSFDDPRLRQMVGRYATYSGSSPFKAPATLACIAHIEREAGCWYVHGGLGRLGAALERVARHVGVRIETGCDVDRIVADDDYVRGVELVGSNDQVGADVVVADVDAAHLYGDLIPRERQRRRLARTKRSSSGFVLCAGVRGRTAGIAHHNVWFSADDRAEFEALEAGRLAVDPTIYGCVSSVTDPTQAPPGCENWFLLVNTPPGIEIDRDAMSARVLGVLADRGVELADRIVAVRTITPADIDERYRSPGGSIYGTSSDGPGAAFRRPNNVGPVDGLYLVGGSSHPGGGLPLVTIGARIVADLIADAS